MACACVRTVYTTVRIAERLARFAWQGTVHQTGLKTEIRLTNDSRLVSGVRGIVEHIASRDGLNDDERASFGVAVEQAARNALEQMGKGTSSCSVTVQEYADRIEVRLSYTRAAAPSRPQPANAGSVEATSVETRRVEAMNRVDRIASDTNDGCAGVTLVKYLHQKSGQQ
jgi:hypothetical protein